MSADCIICGKHKRDNPSVGGSIYEDDYVYLSHYPLDETGQAHLGHLILEPKRHITGMEELNEQEQLSLIKTLTNAHHALKKVVNVDRIYTFSIGEQARHLHFHLIPRYDSTPKEFYGTRLMEYTGDRTSDEAKVKDLSVRIKSMIDR